VAAGEMFRVVQYLRRQSFWDDEAALLLNVRHYAIGPLPFHRLDFYPAHQAAPPVFLWVTKWMGERFHYSEYAVRLLPLVCSMAALPLFALLAWRVAPAAAAWAVALMAFSDALIFQAATAKPYSGDVLVAALILLAAVSGSASPQRKMLRAAAVAAVGLWFSYAAVFSLAAAAIFLAAQLPRHGVREWARLAVCAAPAGVSLVLVYHLSMRAQRDANLETAWIHAFPDFSRPWSIPAWLVGSTWEVFQDQMYPAGPIMLAGAAVGVWTLWRSEQMALLLLLTAPLALNLLAAALHQYPYAGTRLTLFLNPGLCMLCGLGATAPAGMRGRVFRVVLAIVPLSAAVVAGYGLFMPQNKGDLRDAVAYLNAHRRPEEPVYLAGASTTGASRAWYVPILDPLMQLHGDPNEPIHGSGFWVVLAYRPRNYRETEPATHQPDAVIDESRSFHGNGADVLWFVAGEGSGK